MEPDFIWALNHLKKMLVELEIPSPKVFVVDRDLALLNALERVFHQVTVFLCIRHIIKDVEKHARTRTFPQESDPEGRSLALRMARLSRTPNVLSSIRHALYASSEEEYDIRHNQLHLLSGTEAAYIDDSVARHLKAAHCPLLDKQADAFWYADHVKVQRPPSMPALKLVHPTTRHFDCLTDEARMYPSNQ